VWEISMCKLLFRLEFIAGFEKCIHSLPLSDVIIILYAAGIRRVISGEDPHIIFNKKIYTKLSRGYDRPKPKYYTLEQNEQSKV
jgi:hypothetical protein